MQQTNDSREAITNRLNEVLRKPHLLCAECSAKNPFWAIPNLGLIICIECAGQYRRKVGVHIAMVRSIKLDVWKRNDVEKLFVWSAAHSKAFRKLFEMSELSITKRANHPNVTREREMVDWLSSSRDPNAEIVQLTLRQFEKANSVTQLQQRLIGIPLLKAGISVQKWGKHIVPRDVKSAIRMLFLCTNRLAITPDRGVRNMIVGKFVAMLDEVDGHSISVVDDEATRAQEEMEFRDRERREYEQKLELRKMDIEKASEEAEQEFERLARQLQQQAQEIEAEKKQFFGHITQVAELDRFAKSEMENQVRKYNAGKLKKE